MTPYADTSFMGALFSFQDEPFTTEAEEWWEQAGHVQIIYSRLNILEMDTVLQRRETCGKKEMTRAEVEESRATFNDLITRNLMILRDATADEIYDEADKIVRDHAPGIPARSLDVMQLALAIILGADTMLSFDPKQRALAAKARLTVHPANMPVRPKV